MLRLVNQLLDFRKFEQHKMQLNLQENDLVGFARNIFESFEALAQKKEISFEFKASASEIILPYDPDKIEKVIYNLLSNALKFTPKQGNVKLTINDLPTEKQVQIIVFDTGLGIKTSEQSRIFERYFQSNTREQQNITGTGIGLALTKGLIDLHGGKIEIESKEGKGSVFKVVLPKTATEATKIEKAQPVEQIKPIQTNPEPSSVEDDKLDISCFIKDKEPYKILIVEDNADLRQSIADSFAEHFTILQAEDGLVGYEMCIEHHPHLVISDVMMPNMDGMELISKIKNDERVSHIPVILLTAKGAVEDQIEGHLAGADAYIPKPFNADYLLANIISVIRNRERLKANYQKEIEINPMVISTSPADVIFMDKILPIIEENLSEPEFNVDKLAEIYGASRVHLNRKIKALTGETPIQFLRNIRLKHAAELLKQKTLNVSEVAWEVGFNDIPTFRKRFKEKFGVTPSEFAK